MAVSVVGREGSLLGLERAGRVLGLVGFLDLVLQDLGRDEAGSQIAAGLPHDERANHCDQGEVVGQTSCRIVRGPIFFLGMKKNWERTCNQGGGTDQSRATLYHTWG